MLAPTRDLVARLNKAARNARLDGAQPRRRGHAGGRQPGQRRRRDPDPPQRPPPRRQRHRLGQERRPLDVTSDQPERQPPCAAPAVRPAHHASRGVRGRACRTRLRHHRPRRPRLHRRRHARHPHRTRGPATALHDRSPAAGPRTTSTSITEVADAEEEFLPGIHEQLTAVDTLDRILVRDGAATSATTELAHATSPVTRLHEAAQRYADAVTIASQRLLREDADEALEVRRRRPTPVAARRPCRPTRQPADGPPTWRPAPTVSPPSPRSYAATPSSRRHSIASPTSSPTSSARTSSSGGLPTAYPTTTAACWAPEPARAPMISLPTATPAIFNARSTPSTQRRSAVGRPPSQRQSATPTTKTSTPSTLPASSTGSKPAASTPSSSCSAQPSPRRRYPRTTRSMPSPTGSSAWSPTSGASTLWRYVGGPRVRG